MRARSYVQLPYFFLAVAGRRLPRLAEGRVEQKSNKGPKSVDFHNNLLRAKSEHQTKPKHRTGPPFHFRLFRRWVRDRGSDLLSRLHQHSRILLLRLSARWRNFKGRLKWRIFLVGRWKPVLDTSHAWSKASEMLYSLICALCTSILLRKLCLYF